MLLECVSSGSPLETIKSDLHSPGLGLKVGNTEALMQKVSMWKLSLGSLRNDVELMNILDMDAFPIDKNNGLVLR